MIVWWDEQKQQAITDSGNKDDKICLIKKLKEDNSVEQILTIEDREGNCVRLFDEEINKLRKNLL